MNNKLIGGGLAVLILLILGYFVYSSQPLVSAQGEASLDVTPDEISVYSYIETKNASLQDAQKANSEIREKAVERLLDMGIDEQDIQFINYQSYPWTEWSNGKSQNKGFVVSQQIVVKTKSFSKTPRIIDAVIESGALVQTIQLELSQEKQNEYKSEALKLASENAKAKAESIAAGQGRSLGRLVSLKSNDFNYYPHPYYMAKEGVASEDSMVEARQAAASIAPQDLKVSGSVSVEYRLSFF